MPSARQSPRSRIVDGQNELLKAIAAECGCHVTDLSPKLFAHVQRVLIECYRRGAVDVHERGTVSPPDAELDVPDAVITHEPQTVPAPAPAPDDPGWSARPTMPAPRKP